MRLKEAGLIEKGRSNYVPKDTKCLSKQKNNANKGKKAEPYKPLSLGHLSGAFIVLFIGYCLAFLVFLAENCYNALFTFAAFIIFYYF